MSFLNSKSSFTRFMVEEDGSKEALENALEKLKKYAFGDIDEIATERAWGWTSFDDMLDTNFEKTPLTKGEYICFSLRLDTRRIPPAVLKKHIRLALMQEEEKMQAVGKKFVSKDRKTEIKEQVKQKLMARFLPIPAEFQVVWSQSKNMLYLASTNTKIIDLFTENFVLTFDLHIEQVTTYTLALSLMGEEVESKLETITQTKFV